MAPIRLESLVFTGAVTFGSGMQLLLFQHRVFAARKKYEVPLPSIRGPPGFERVIRAQQNALELYPVYLTTLWTSSLFLHPVPAAVFGMIYLISQRRYFRGYEESEDDSSLPKFKVGAICIAALSLMSIIGLIKTMRTANIHRSATETCEHVLRTCRFQ